MLLVTLDYLFIYPLIHSFTQTQSVNYHLNRINTRGFTKLSATKVASLSVPPCIILVGLALWQRVGLDQRSYSTLGPVSSWMGGRLRAGKLSRYVTSHPGQLSLAIPPWVGAMSTSLGWEGNRRSDGALAMCDRQ